MNSSTTIVHKNASNNNNCTEKRNIRKNELNVVKDPKKDLIRTKVSFDDSSVDYSSLRIPLKANDQIHKAPKRKILNEDDNMKRNRSRRNSWGNQFGANMVDFTDAEKIILDAVDRIEDEIDTKIPIPFRIRFFFEDSLFGWDHLSSDILGSLLYPTIMFITQYHIFLLLWELLINQSTSLICFGRDFDQRDGGLCQKSYFEWMQFDGKYKVGFGFIRFTYSLSAAIITFRAIRRRRKVWFRSTYGSKAYLAESKQRRKEVHEVDRTTILGRIRKNVRKRKDQILARRVRKKLSKANIRFERKASRVNLKQLAAENELKSSGDQISYDHMMVESVAHDQVYLCDNIQRVPYAHGGYFGAAPFMLADPIWVDVLRTLMPNVYVEVARRIFTPAPKLIHWGENNPVVAAYGTAHTLEWSESSTTTRPITLEWDVFLDPALASKLEVAMNEREKLLKRLHWKYYSPFDENAYFMTKKRLTELEASQQLGDSNHAEILLLQVLELRDKEVRRRTQHLLDKMLIAHGTLSQLILEQTGLCKNYVYARVQRTRKTLGGGIYAHQWLAVYAEALRIGLYGKKDATGITSSYGSSSSSNDSSPAAICHLYSSSEASEHDSQFEDRCHSPQASPSKFLNANATLGSFNDFIQPSLSRKEDINLMKVSPLSPTPQQENSQSTSLDALATSLCPSYPVAKSVEIINSILLKYEKQNVSSTSPSNFQLGLVLDLKSRHVSKKIWAMLVDVLRLSNIRVEGVASFVPDEIRGISEHACEPVNEVVFCHSAGDLQALVHEGRIKENDTVYFNAGSLIWDMGKSNLADITRMSAEKCLGSFDPNERKSSYKIQPYARCIDKISGLELRKQSTIQAYKEAFNLHIGLYCQEFAIDESAMNCIVRFINQNVEIYDLGLSWGGLNGVSVADIQPGRFTSTDGLWNQRYVGKRWREDLCPYDLS